MDAMSALASVMTSAAFEATADGRVTTSNPLFVQLLRRVPGDDWRDSVAPQDRTLVDSFWNELFRKPGEALQPITFRLNGSESRYQLRAQGVSGAAGIVSSAVGIVVVEEDAVSAHRWEVDTNTGLPDRAAVLQLIDELATEQRECAVAVVLLEPEDAADDVRRKEAARQILSTLRPSDLVASSPDGSFVLCATDVAEDDTAMQLARRLSSALGDSSLPARIGVAMMSPDIAPATLVREAEAGAYAATPGEVGVA